MTRTSLLDELLSLMDEHQGADWFQQNARAYLEVCSLFGQSAAQHHDGLVRRFIENPAAKLSAQAAPKESPPADPRRCRCCCAHSKCCET